MIGTNKYGALGDSFSASRTLVERNLEKSVVDIAVGPHYTCAVCSGYYCSAIIALVDIVYHIVCIV